MPIPISQLPSELIYNGQLDVSNPAKQTQYNSLNSAWEKNSGGGGASVPNITMDDIGGSSLDYAKSLTADSDRAFNDYAMAARGQEKPLDIYSRLEGAAGIPVLRKTASTLSGQVNDLEDTIRRVEGNVSATTKNSYVTEGQRSGMITENKKPLQENLGWLSQSLGRVLQGIQLGTADIGNKVGLAVQGQDRELEPFKINMSRMSDRAAMLMTGFNADKQARLDILTNKMQRQFQLEDREYAEMQALAKEERDFLKQKDMFSFQQNNTPQRQIVDVGGQKKLIDPMTGQIISTYNDVATGTGDTPWYGSVFGLNPTVTTPQQSTQPSSSGWRIKK